MSNEIFKDIEGYEGLYQVSNLGNIKSLHCNKEKIMKPTIRSNNYQYYFVGLLKEYQNKCREQKEFIEYLENKININPYDISDYAYEDIINRILSKYKEIIGDDK